MTTRRFRLDADVQRYPRVLVGGSPHSVFRLTDAGDRVVDRIEAGEPVEGSALVDALLDGGAIHPAVAPAADDHHEPPRFGVGDVTIVVPTLGQPGPLPNGVRTIVVDDGSDPPVDGATIRRDVTGGPAAARNTGLAAVETPLVAFVDADVRAADGWLDRLLPHFDDDRVALVAPRVVTAGGQTRLARHEAIAGPLDLGTDPGRVRSGTKIGYVPSAALVCRTDRLRSIGGFDEGLRFGEDVDLVWRLDEAGWRCRYEPASVVEHDPRPTWAAWVRQRIDYGSSAAPLALRHHSALAPLRTNGWSLAAWTLPLLGNRRRPAVIGLAAGGIVATGSALALVPKLPDVPAREAVRFALRGHRGAGANLAHAVRRTYWPLLAVASIVSPAARRALTLSAVAARSPVRLADDLAYSVGVWRGMVRHRTAEPLRPVVAAWPPRRRRAAGRRS